MLSDGAPSSFRPTQVLVALQASSMCDAALVIRHTHALPLRVTLWCLQTCIGATNVQQQEPEVPAQHKL